MRIMAKRNETDSDMIELWCRSGKSKMLMCVVHQDCLGEIPHITDNGAWEAGDDLFDDGMMLILDSTTVTTEEARFWGI